jgi:hypothetical protein
MGGFFKGEGNRLFSQLGVSADKGAILRIAAEGIEVVLWTGAELEMLRSPTPLSHEASA